MKIYYIIVRTQFDGIHQWKDCSIDEVDFLKERHRHTFFVTVKIKVSHDDRAVEFIQAKNRLDVVIKTYGTSALKELGSKSCEMIAEEIGDSLIGAWNYRVQSVYVSEDGLLDGGVEYE